VLETELAIIERQSNTLIKNFNIGSPVSPWYRSQAVLLC